MRIICVSDTHSKHDQMPVIPDGDVLVHAGDLSLSGSTAEVAEAGAWLGSLPHKHKVLVAGNHDWAFYKPHTMQDAAYFMARRGIHYLRDQSVELEGINFYGSPWQPAFCDWAFNLPRDGDELEERWSRIPHDTNVLVTHGPPYGVLDHCPCINTGKTISVGCKHLAEAVKRVAPRLHVFGHIHEGYGMQFSGLGVGTQFVNASSCTGRYAPTNLPIVVDI